MATTKYDVTQLAYEYAKENFKPKEFVPGVSRVPVSGAVISPEDVMGLVDVSLRGWYTEHRCAQEFSKKLSQFVQKGMTVLCNSGSSANLLAITGMLENDLRRKYILTCATGFPTTVAPIYQNGQIPIYVDIDPVTLAPDYKQIERAVRTHGSEISGGIFAHTLGFPYDEPQVWEMLQDQWLVADACDALGARTFFPDLPEPISVGGYARAVTYSFFPAHQITAGEGGAVSTNDLKLYSVISSLCNWGRDCQCAPGQSGVCGKRFDWEWEHLPKGWDHKYTFTRVGYNLKMTELQASLGLSQLFRIGEFVQIRQRNFRYLRDGLGRYGEHLQFVEIPAWSDPSPFGFPITVKKNSPVDPFELISYLEDHKISTRRVFGGNLTRQPGFAKMKYLKVGPLDGSDFVMRNTFWIGCHPELTLLHLAYVRDVFESFFREKGLA